MWEWELGWTWLGRVADALSLVTAVVSVYAAWKIRKIGARLAFNVRADGVLERIDALCDQIRQLLLADGSDLYEIRNLVIRCKAEVDTMRHGVTGAAAKSASRVDADYKNLDRLPQGEQSARAILWDVLNGMCEFTIHARNLHASRRLGASNDS